MSGPADKRRVRLGVLGGTFDPIHRAHLAVAAAAREALRLDDVLFVPAGDPWRKRDREITPAQQRLAMVSAVLATHSRYRVSDVEVARDGPSYTVDTLNSLRQEGYETIWFIVGSDALHDLPHWHEPRRLIELARLAVIVRPQSEFETAQLDALLPGLADVVDIVPMPPVELNATDLRHRLASGDDVGDAIPPAALAYIRAHRLYNAGATAKNDTPVSDQR